MKGIRNSLFTLLSIAFGLAATAQTNISVGSGTGTTSTEPINGYYGYSYTQNIYLASDMIAAGATSAGTISKIRFYYNSGGNGANSNNWTVYLGHTNKTAFTSNTDWVASASMTNCFSGTFTMPGAGNWVEITLTTPFQWNGIDNLIIGVDENQPSYASSTMYWKSTTAPSNRSIYYYNDNTNPDPASPPTASGTSNALPNLQFDWLIAPACTTNPAHVNSTVNDGTICPGDMVTFGISSYEFVSGLTYQWQSNDGSGWTNINGATGANYSTNGITQTANYRNVLTCAAAALSDTAEDVTVMVNPLPVVVVDNNDVAICSGEPAEVVASGADTYSWSPTTAVSPSATSASVTLMPTTTTVYTVTGTTAAGCSATATTKVTPIAMVQSSVSYSPAENCSPGSVVTQTVTGLPSTITSGGTWEYRWLAADGVTVLQDWSASNTYSFTPSIDSTYGSFYQVRSTSCTDNQIDSVYSDIIIGFGADVAVTDFNCNSEGMISLSNTFGQIPVDTLYANPLNNLANMADFALTGNASVTGNRLQLTPSAGGQSGYAVLTTPGFDPGINNSMTVSFNMTADMPIDNYGTGGADGIAYSFGDDAVPASPGSGHNGKGSKLRLSFDAANNGTENGNATGVYLVWGWNSATAFGPGSAQTLAYSPNVASWKLKTDVPVVFAIDADGKASVTVGGTVIFNNIQMPAAYMNANVSNWKHMFSASTGGDAMRQAVSNLAITEGNLNYGITAGGSSTAPTTWQQGKTFSNLAPGSYDIWISKDEAGTCLKNIGTYEVLNTNPVVDLGNDTTICDAETLLLDAGNPGASYVWSGSNNYTQTMEVSEAGSYIVYVTDAVGCLGIGTINVDVNEAPSATSIYSQGSFPIMNFSVVGAENADTYDWNFGDGNSIMNAPASVSHFYTNDGTYTVTVTLSNDCGTDVETTSITIIDYTGIDENSIVNLEVYPNPASSQITVSVPNSEASEVTIYSISGAMIQGATTFNNKTSIDVSNWESGIYFMNVTNQGKQSVTKFVVE